jgi:hypothetical protein
VDVDNELEEFYSFIHHCSSARKDDILLALSMASTILQLVPSITTAIFSLLSFIFSLLAVTSKQWAVRDNYDPNLNPLDWKTPIYTLYRSPFSVCTAIVNASTTDSSPATSSNFHVQCTQFRPNGFNHTSCELAIATQDDTAPTVGDARLCQQIHYAGNYWITSSTFIGVAFLLTLVLTIFTLVKKPQFASDKQPLLGKPMQREAEQQDDSMGGNEDQPLTSTQQQGSVWVPWVSLLLLIFFFIGLVTALIGQYYGVLGLIQSQPNNADFASSSAGSKDDINTQGNHGPWYQGVGLSIYATCSWGFAIAAGVIASRSWPLPQWKVVL